MSSANSRIAIFPTRMALTNMKLRLKGAQTGHSLLKKKADALQRRFRDIVNKIRDVFVFVVLFEIGQIENGRRHAGRFFLLLGSQIFYW